MAKLICRHFPITRCRSNSSFLTPDEKWDGDQEDNKGDNCTQNMQVSQTHLIDPRREHKQYNHREDVSHENNPNQCVADNLEAIKLERKPQHSKLKSALTS